MSRLMSGMTSVLIVAIAATTARAETLEKELLKQAPVILKFAREHGYKNLGVLKFRVKKGDEAATDSAGPLNANLASRLEVALVLANPNDADKQVAIISDASKVASGIRGANHLTKEGRLALFDGRYSLPWGEEKVTADAFVTGVVALSGDDQVVNVGLLAFGKDAKLEKVGSFEAAADPALLFESGESFLVRGAFDGGKPIPVAVVVKDAGRVRTKETPFPLVDTQAPVELDIYYDDRKVAWEVRDGRAWVPEPREGQKIHFIVRRKHGVTGTYGIVLMVNGENTLYRQRLPVKDCRKWILEPNVNTIEVEGFKINEKEMERFRVLSRAESKKNEIYYGADVGTIALAVFREWKAKEEPGILTDEEEDLAALSHGVFPGDRPKNLAALKSRLRSDASATRGLIVGGERVGFETRKVKFVADPTPVMTAVVTYYRP
jgi:hypothetical protein